MPSIDCKVELKLKWTKYFALYVAGDGNNINEGANANNFIFTIKDSKLYVPLVILSAKDNQKVSKLLSKRYERSVSWNEYKTKIDNKNTTNKFRYFLESNFVGVNTLFVLVYSNHDNNVKRFKANRYYLPKGIIKKYNVIINEKLLWSRNWFWYKKKWRN